jgi:hypothetical protein
MSDELAKAWTVRRQRRRDQLRLAGLILFVVLFIVTGWLFLHDPAGLMNQ